jgi:hypothetical protein
LALVAQLALVLVAQVGLVATVVLLVRLRLRLTVVQVVLGGQQQTHHTAVVQVELQVLAQPISRASVVRHLT